MAPASAGKYASGVPSEPAGSSPHPAVVAAHASAAQIPAIRLTAHNFYSISQTCGEDDCVAWPLPHENMRAVTRRFSLLAAALASAALMTAIAIAATSTSTGVIGPQNRIQPSGRQLSPVGKLTPVGNHPGGGALTTNGRFLWVLDAGRGINDIKIVDAAPELGCKSGSNGNACRKAAKKRLGRLIQTIRMPGVSGGIAMSPNGTTVYVSGVADSSHKDQKAPAGTPGLKGDVLHVFTYNASTGKAKRAGLIGVPPPPGVAAPQVIPGGVSVGNPTPQTFPPTSTGAISWPRDIGISPNGNTLLVALNLADRAAIVDLKTKAVRYVQVGHYPYGAAITRDGKGLVSNETDATVSVIDLASGQKVKDITVGAHLSHPEGIAIDPKAARAYVAVAHEDRIAVIDTAKMEVVRKLSVARAQGIGTEPTQLSVTADGCRLLASDSGEDAVAVFALKAGCDTKRAAGTGGPGSSGGRGNAGDRQGQGQSQSQSQSQGDDRAKLNPIRAAAAKPFQLLGRIPVASYPVFAGATPKRERLAYIAAKGLGVGPNPNGPNPLSPNNSDDAINTFQYLPSIVSGLAGSALFPTDAELRKLTPRANAQVKPIDAKVAPANTPLRPGGPIKHVFYIVRENRTYDQVLGDDPRGDGAPNLTLFGQNLTPNAHLLAKRFPLLDHVYANSEASIDGHFWTAAGAVSDYVVKNWHQNYGGRGRPYDFGVYSVTWPAKRFLFDAMEEQGISYFNYGEAIAGTVPFPDKDRRPDESQQVLRKFSKSDLGEAGITLFGIQVPSTNCYPNDASIGKDAITQQDVYDSTGPGTPGSLSRTACFRQKFAIQDATGTVPAFNYLILTNDHTNGLSPGRRTPQSMVADNDYALGQIVDTISHSSIWKSSLIVVMEDDSQDGADHVDAHRIPAFVISPYAKRGAVIHTRYDFPSMIRTSELPIGMKPFTLFDALATPMYDAFDSTPKNLQTFDAVAPNISLTTTNPATPANKAAVRGYDMTATDSVPQRVLDRQLWHAVHGHGSKPPAPGPNASGIDTHDADG
jgi:DNA-binding beta-propeller fold protein YncE